MNWIKRFWIGFDEAEEKKRWVLFLGFIVAPYGLISFFADGTWGLTYLCILVASRMISMRNVK